MKKAMKILNLFMILISLIVSGFIFVNKDYSMPISKKIYGLIDNFLFINANNNSVNNSLNYIKLKDNFYYNDSYSIYSPFIATILEIDTDSIYLKCNNDFVVCFKNIINIKVNKYDVVDTNVKLANFIDYFQMYFIKGDKTYSYEEVIEYLG